MTKKTDDVMAEDKESVETLKDFIINHVNHFYVNHIPFDSIKDMSSTCTLSSSSSLLYVYVLL